jgi:hypothetical protein
MTELPQRSMQSLRASAALIASVANVAYTAQGKQALAAEWAGKEGGAVALVAPLLLFDPPGVPLRGKQSVKKGVDVCMVAGLCDDCNKRDDVVPDFNAVCCRGRKSGSRQHVRSREAGQAHERGRFSMSVRRSATPHPSVTFSFFLFNDHRPLFLLTPSGAASLQEFIIRVGDAKKTKEDGDSLLGCAKVCNNVSAFAAICALLFLTLYGQVLSALSNAALDDSFACAVLGKKVNEALVRAGSCGSSCVFVFVAGGRHPRQSLCYRGLHHSCPAAAAAID